MTRTSSLKGANMPAFTLEGFESPEEVQARIGKAKEGAFMPKGDINSLIYQTAARGQAGIGDAIQGALGQEDPQVAKARKVQELMQGLEPDDPESYFEGSKRLNAAGMTQEALKMGQMGNDLLNKQKSADAKGRGRGDYWTLESFVDAEGTTVKVPYNHRTNTYDWSGQKALGTNGKLIDPKDPKNKARIKDAEKRAEITAKEETDAKIALPAIKSDANYLSSIIDQVTGHEAFVDVVGAPSLGKLAQYVSGTPEADFKALQEQVGGKTFMQAYKTLKGGGQITEIEGTKATDAIQRMKTSSSEKAYLAAANDFKNEIQRFVRLSEIRAGMSPVRVKLDQKASGRATQIANDANGERVFEINGVWQYADGKKYGAE